MINRNFKAGSGQIEKIKNVKLEEAQRPENFNKSVQKFKKLAEK